MFVPSDEKSVFISYGAQVKMYTLRVIYSGEVVYANGTKRKSLSDYYVKNLSTDREKAIEKAIEYASAHGIEFVSTEAASMELEEIHRRSREEVQHNIEEREKREAELQKQQEEELVILLDDQFGIDVMSFGKYKGHSFDHMCEFDPEYVKYILSFKEYPVTPRTINDLCANNLYAYVQANPLAANPEESSEFVGNIKDRISIDVTVKHKVSFDSYYSIKTMYKFIDKDGNVLVTFYSGHAWKLNVGDQANITGTVDKHQLYDSVNQTTLKRVKVNETYTVET